MSKKVKITLTLSEEDASILRQLAANDIRTLPKYCEMILIRTARANKPPVIIPPQQQVRNPNEDLL